MKTLAHPESVAPTASGWLELRESSRDAASVTEAEIALARTALKGLPVGGRPLSDSRVFMAGLGAAGGVAYRLLVQSGVGAIDAVDPDSYGSDSFLTQTSTWKDAGQPKAIVQRNNAADLNPAVRIRTAVGPAQHVRLRDLRLADLFLIAGDNLAVALWCGSRAAGLGKPMVQAAVHGETASAIVRGYDLRDGEGACPRCGLSQQELQHQSVRHGCDVGATVPLAKESTRTQPTICNVAGAMAASEAIKWLTGNEDLALRGEEALVSTLAFQSWRTALRRDSQCAQPHRKWELVDLETEAHETSLRDIVEHDGPRPDEIPQIRSELDWISFTFCSACQQRADVRRFARLDAVVGRCDCGEPLKPVPQGAHSIVPPQDLRACWEKPLSEIGITAGEAVGLRRDETWHYFFTNDQNWRKIEPTVRRETNVDGK